MGGAEESERGENGYHQTVPMLFKGKNEDRKVSLKRRKEVVSCATGRDCDCRTQGHFPVPTSKCPLAADPFIGSLDLKSGASQRRKLRADS
jgi:hypothetical protein